MKKEKNISKIETYFENKTLPPSFYLTIRYEDGSDAVSFALEAQKVLEQYGAYLTVSQRQLFENQADRDREMLLPARLFRSSHLQTNQSTHEEGDEGKHCCNIV